MIETFSVSICEGANGPSDIAKSLFTVKHILIVAVCCQPEGVRIEFTEQ